MAGHWQNGLGFVRVACLGYEHRAVRFDVAAPRHRAIGMLAMRGCI